jgi:hypothetical protein
MVSLDAKSTFQVATQAKNHRRLSTQPRQSLAVAEDNDVSTRAKNRIAEVRTTSNMKVKLIILKVPKWNDEELARVRTQSASVRSFFSYILARNSPQMLF